MARLRGDVIRRNAEITRRNEAGVEAWRDKRLTGIVAYADAWPPVWRQRLDAWFVDQREVALRWMFKRRCARGAAGHPGWVKTATVLRR